ncbi:hypothetical protein E2C01_041023 [Portunus trituberculatus]|uniref:Uncharacterized protein n=1 Tax=Portunus trituberculatus TaxID=210409 RepID=A0A5B7FIX7_PORTR|nr:hypothetical protein [Portunus trituberculatus]
MRAILIVYSLPCPVSSRLPSVPSRHRVSPPSAAHQRRVHSLRGTLTPGHQMSDLEFHIFILL